MTRSSMRGSRSPTTTHSDTQFDESLGMEQSPTLLLWSRPFETTYAAEDANNRPSELASGLPLVDPFLVPLQVGLTRLDRLRRED